MICLEEEGLVFIQMSLAKEARRDPLAEQVGAGQRGGRHDVERVGSQRNFFRASESFAHFGSSQGGDKDASLGGRLFQ